MNTFKTSLALGTALTLLVAAPAFALNMGLGAGATPRAATTTVKATAASRLETRINTARERANQEIDRRTAVLNEYNVKVQAMVRLTSEQKTDLEKFLQDQIAALSALKTKIASDTEMDALKADIKTITQSYRIFVLVMPQAHMSVAADRIGAATDKLSALEVKLATRIATKKSGGGDVSSLETLDTDMKAKLASATTDASAAVTAAMLLTPDNGDQSKATANKKSLQDARAKIKSALQALTDARKDAGEIVAGLKGVTVSQPATTTTSTP